MKLYCAVCLYQELEDTLAVSIVNGQAVCEPHFDVIAKNQTSNASVLALRTVGHPYFEENQH